MSDKKRAVIAFIVGVYILGALNMSGVYMAAMWECQQPPERLRAFAAGLLWPVFTATATVIFFTIGKVGGPFVCVEKQ